MTPYRQPAIRTTLLEDGTCVQLRATTPADLPAVIELHEQLSPDSLYFRFFSYGVDLHRTVGPLVTGDASGVVAIVDDHIIGHGCVVPESLRVAELGFVVAEEWRHRGIASLLLRHLAVEAALRGVETLTASVLDANHPMLDVLEELGLPIAMRRRDGVVEVRIEEPAAGAAFPPSLRRSTSPQPVVRPDGALATG